MNWQPIETAPKDGTRFLAINIKEQFVVCQWEEMEWAEGYSPCVFPLSDATHWMPLPPPPETKE